MFGESSLEFSAAHLTSRGNIDLDGMVINGGVQGKSGSVSDLKFKGGICYNVPASLNADTLGGHSASHFASKSDIPSVPSTTSYCYGLTSSTTSVTIDGVSHQINLPVTIKHNFYIK